jgi:hypothetical protein
MPDESTMRDHLEDVMRENQELRTKLRVYQKIAADAYAKAGGHIDPCLRGVMCSCGLTQYMMIRD